MSKIAKARKEFVMGRTRKGSFARRLEWMAEKRHEQWVFGAAKKSFFELCTEARLWDEVKREIRIFCEYPSKFPPRHALINAVQKYMGATK